MKRVLMLATTLAVVTACSSGASAGTTSAPDTTTSTTSGATSTTVPVTSTTVASDSSVPVDAVDVSHVSADVNGDGNTDDIYGYLTADRNRVLEVVLSGGDPAEVILPGPPDTAPVVEAAPLGSGDTASILVKDVAPDISTFTVELYGLDAGAIVPIPLGTGDNAPSAEFVVRDETGHVSGVTCDPAGSGHALAVDDVVKADNGTYTVSTTTYTIDASGALERGDTQVTTLASPDKTTLDGYATLACPA